MNIEVEQGSRLASGFVDDEVVEGIMLEMMSEIATFILLDVEFSYMGNN